jgi:hypothetical protein
MTPLPMPREPLAPNGQSLAAGLPPSRTLRAAARWPFGPSLTAAAPTAGSNLGRGGKTSLQPNGKTANRAGHTRTDHALQAADIFTRHRQDGLAFAGQALPAHTARP